MTNVICEWVDDCVRIRLACGDANLLTTEVLRELSEAITVAESRGRGVLFCGGDKFFSNGVDLSWGAENLDQVKYAIMETNGGISIVPKDRPSS